MRECGRVSGRHPDSPHHNQIIIPSAVSHSVSQCTVSHSVSPSVSAQSQSVLQSVVRSGSAVSQSAVSFFLVWVSCVSPKHSQLTHSHSLTHSLTRFNRPPQPTHPTVARAHSFPASHSPSLESVRLQLGWLPFSHSLLLSLTHSLTPVTDRPTADCRLPTPLSAAQLLGSFVGCPFALTDRCDDTTNRHNDTTRTVTSLVPSSFVTGCWVYLRLVYPTGGLRKVHQRSRTRKSGRR